MAGTQDQSFYVTTAYWNGCEWQDVSINDYETTGFLNFEQCKGILNQNNPRILHYDVDLGRFIEKANKINQSLHKNGVAARDRAKMVAGLLLALAQDSTMQISDEPRTLVNDVNTRIESLLVDHKKEDFKAEVSLKLPNTPENHIKYWAAIVQTMQHLREMNIRSAINSGTDALGQFYETFLKYANDASEIGIVLTPRHVTRFAVKVMDIEHTDLIFDPTCGTGGFLVAALDEIRTRHYDKYPDVYAAFRNDCLFGIEQADDVFGLALVNMIFRGDGKSHIHNGNCFDNHFVRLDDGEISRKKITDKIDKPTQKPFSRVLMNPPFALEEEKERDFVDYALKQTKQGGLLFAILPNAPITGSNADEGWRREIVKRHTVRAVVKLPADLFQPSAQKGTWALILEAWRPHQSEDKVFFGFMYDDRSAAQKSKMIARERAKDNLDLLTHELARFMKDGRARVESVPREITISTLNMDCDFASEAYLESDVTDLKTLTPYEGLFTELTRQTIRQSRFSVSMPKSTKEFHLESLFTIKRGKCRALKDLPEGKIPVVTASEKSNGIAGYRHVEPDHLNRNQITISANGGGGAAFWHPYEFGAVPDVLVCQWQEGWSTTPEFCLYICDAISQNSWRFDYYRKSTQSRASNDIRVRLPMDGDCVDYAYIEREMNRMPGFKQFLDMLNGQTV